MEILGSQVIPASQQAVWDALNSPEVLKKCLPGCESVELVSPNLFKVVITAAIGPLKAKFNGTLNVTEAVPPQSCVLIFEGQGGAVGFGKGSSSVSLSAVEGGTELKYSAQAHVGGKLAQIGSRLIDSVAKKCPMIFLKLLIKKSAINLLLLLQKLHQRQLLHHHQRLAPLLQLLLIVLLLQKLQNQRRMEKFPLLG